MSKTTRRCRGDIQALMALQKSLNQDV